MKMIVRSLCLSMLLTSGGASVWACCMVPATYEGSIGQEAQEGVVIHDGDREELILRINYRIEGKTLPDNFAWVITVPQEPDAYALADPALFKEMFQLSGRLLVPKPRSFGFGSKNVDSAVPQGVELGKRVQVGPYDIQPVRGVGPNALQGLNIWLKDHGFPTEDPGHMTYFVKNNFTFLCVRILPADKAPAVGAGGMLPPLHLSFQSEKPYYPLRFSSRQGIFDVNLHLLTRKEFDYKASADTLARLNWSSQRYKRNVKLSEKAMPESLKKVFAKSVWKDNIGTWRYNNPRCSRVNRGDTIRQWKEDIFFSIK